MDGISTGNAACPPWTRTTAPKLAKRIATQISERILVNALPAGTPLGTEADLLAEYGSSRSTIREAIAMLELDGIVTTRRGRGGGLFVAPLDMLALSHAMRAYFEYMDVGVDEVISTRRILNRLAVRLSAERLDQSDVAGLRRPGMGFWALLKSTKNPVLDILARSARRFEILALLRSSVTEREYFDMLEEASALQAQQADAVIGGNLQLALEIGSEWLSRSERFMYRCLDRPRSMTRPELLQRLEMFVGRQRPLKKPEVVTYALMHDILSLGWPPGHHLGSEQEMLDRYSVGRSVFREAIRPMEQFGIVEMRTGRRSGLKVSAPTPDQVVAEGRRRFERLQTPAHRYTEVLAELGAAIAAQAAQGHHRIGSLADTSVKADVYADASLRFERLLTQANGNRICSLMLQLLRPHLTIKDHAAEAVLAAIDAGDAPLAHRTFLWLSEEARP